MVSAFILKSECSIFYFSFKLFCFTWSVIDTFVDLLTKIVKKKKNQVIVFPLDQDPSWTLQHKF